MLPISVDSTATLGEFRRKHAMKVDLLRDFRRDVSRAYVEENPGRRRENHEILAQIARLT